MTWIDIIAAILGPVGFIALGRAWLGMAFNGQRDEWIEFCIAVAVFSFVVLWMLGAK